MNKYHVGIDLHKHIAQYCVLDSEGEVLKELRIKWTCPAEALAAVDELLAWKDGGRFAVEALGVSRWFYKACCERGLDIVLVDPFKLGLRKTGKKTDRRDALEIARRLRNGDVEQHALSYHCTDEEYAVRRLGRAHHYLTQRLTSFRNQIHSMLAAFNLGAPPGAMTSKKSRAWLRSLKFDHPALEQAFASLVNCLEAVNREVTALKRQMRKLDERPAPAAEAPPPSAAPTPPAPAEVEPLARRPIAERMQVLRRDCPSVAHQTAALLAAELGDVTRFKGTREVSSYSGLAPRVANSADRSHHGSITKRGSNHLRWILSQWAVRLLRGDPIAKAWAAPRLKRMHKNKVRMALARRLLVGVYITLSRGEVFSLARCLPAS